MLTAVPLLQAGALMLAYLVFTLWCYRLPLRRFMQRRQGANILVAYASEGGTAAALAEQLQQQLQQQGDHAHCVPLNQLQLQTLLQARQLFIIASTYGDGEAPDNGRFFLPRLQQWQTLFPHLQYAVLALGDRHYARFCAFGLQVQQALQQCCARPLFPPVLMNGQDVAALEQWQQQLTEQGVLAQPQSISLPVNTISPVSARLLKRQWLNPGSPGSPMFHIRLQTSSVLRWQAGDIARIHIGTDIREYTIANACSGRDEPAELHLLVREQHYPDGRPGLGSGFLCHDLEPGSTALVSVRSNPAFHAPQPERPLILIGNGTGLAGLRAHLEERAQRGSSHNWLIFGERSPAHDRPWHAELQQWLEQGHLHQLDLAFSRHDPGQPWPAAPGRLHHGYVQTVLQQQAAELRHWIEQGAAVYLCGSREGMATGVEHTLRQLLGDEHLQALSAAGRYRRDVY